MTITNAESEGDIDTHLSQTVTEVVTPAPSLSRTEEHPRHRSTFVLHYKQRALKSCTSNRTSKTRVRCIAPSTTTSIIVVAWFLVKPWRISTKSKPIMVLRCSCNVSTLSLKFMGAKIMINILGCETIKKYQYKMSRVPMFQ